MNLTWIFTDVMLILMFSIWMLIIGHIIYALVIVVGSMIVILGLLNYLIGILLWRITRKKGYIRYGFMNVVLE